jgi:hypothetical protein
MLDCRDSVNFSTSFVRSSLSFRWCRNAKPPAIMRIAPTADRGTAKAVADSGRRVARSIEAPVGETLAFTVCVGTEMVGDAVALSASSAGELELTRSVEALGEPAVEVVADTLRSAGSGGAEDDLAGDPAGRST